jgi:hypothetical protein
MTKTATTQRAARRLEDNDVFRLLVRVGYVTNGILHLLIGLLALQVAFGDAATADQNGALGAIAAVPAGVVVLWVVVIGTWALGVFQLVELITVRGSNGKANVDRAKYVGKAVAYIVVGLTALGVALRGSAGGTDAKTVSSQVLGLPGGVALLLALAALIVGVGLYLVAKGARQRFLGDVTLPSGGLRSATIAIGTAGYIAKGIAVLIIGGFLGAAALTADASKAEGLDGALTSITQLPFGAVLLVLVALGLVLFGLYCFVRARHAKM